MNKSGRVFSNAGSLFLGIVSCSALLLGFFSPGDSALAILLLLCVIAIVLNQIHYAIYLVAKQYFEERQ